MFKRLAAAVSVTALIAFGSVSGASAAPKSSESHPVVIKAPKVKHWKVIDWDAPPADGGATTQRIDWD